VTPTTGRDQNGDEIPITTGRLEEHVTADVAWSAWRYATWTGRWSFLRGAGRPLIVDTARYLARRPGRPPRPHRPLR
jgi:trehalose/maltose hydrolase-like predicted phosphorylase